MPDEQPQNSSSQISDPAVGNLGGQEPQQEQEDNILSRKPTRNEMLFGIFVIAAIAGGIFIFSRFFDFSFSNRLGLQNTPSTTSTPGVEISKTPGVGILENWQTYTNSGFNFEFKYPQGFVAISEKGAGNFSNGEFVLGLAREEAGQKTNTIIVSIFKNGFENYRLVDNPGGFTFHFDAESNQWLHKDDTISEFLPKKMNVLVEAYIHGTGDVNCTWDIIPIPEPSYSYVVELINMTCAKLEPTGDASGAMDYFPPDFKLDSEELLSTFQFTDQIDTSNWQTYRNEEFGFEVKYPGDWNLEDGSKFISLHSKSDQGSGIYGSSYPINITVRNKLNTQSINEWLDNNVDEANIVSSKESSEIDGMPAVSFIETGYVTYASVYINGGNFILHINTPKDTIYNSIYDQILSTFRFIE